MKISAPDLKNLTCFKAYDVRGQLGTQLTKEVAYNIGRGYGELLKPETIVVGGDVRLSSESLKAATADGLRDAGVNIIDIGMVGTEEIYFATSHLGVCGGIEVTASHNPIDYNGMKFVSAGSRPISADTGLLDIKAAAQSQNWTHPKKPRGTYTKTSILDAYVDHLMAYIEPKNIKPLKLVMNAGNGAAGHVVDALEQALRAAKVPFDLIKIHHEPDPSFPNGIPNPLLPDNRADTTQAVRKYDADMGIAWDGDFDRCFLFDETGAFIEGYYIVGLLAEAFLQKKSPHNQSERIVFDPRVYWNSEDIITTCKGVPVMTKSGHAFMKQAMRDVNAVYGGEMSAHHYFRDFFYCDSGMIPWLLVTELLSVKNQPLSHLVKDRIAKYPSSGEVNYTVDDAAAVFKRIEAFDWGETPTVKHIDGLDFIFDKWRFNLRSSNTEPVIRLNVETRADTALLVEKFKLVESLIS